MIDLQAARHMIARRASSLMVLACLVATAPVAGAVTEKLDGWQLEPGVNVPSYAVIDPVSTNLNVDTVVLVCEQASHRRILQLQMYLSTDGPLSPNGIAPRQLKDDPRAEAVIDGRVLPVQLLFSDAYVLLADEEAERFPMLSERLLDAMQSGERMVLRFDLVAEPVGQPARFDGEVVIDLNAGVGGAAISAVRRCVEDGAVYSAGVHGERGLGNN
jgi:hypothetical protein